MYLFLIDDITYKTLTGAKPLRIRFNKVKGFIRVYDGTRYLVLFGPEKYDAICNSIKCLICQESVIRYIISNNYAKINIGLYDFLPVEKNIDFA